MRQIVVKIQSIMDKYQITSLSELSDMTGVRRATLSELANGKRDRIQLDHIAKIAAALEIKDMNEIIGFD